MVLNVNVQLASDALNRENAPEHHVRMTPWRRLSQPRFVFVPPCSTLALRLNDTPRVRHGGNANLRVFQWVYASKACRLGLATASLMSGTGSHDWMSDSHCSSLFSFSALFPSIRHVFPN